MRYYCPPTEKSKHAGNVIKAPPRMRWGEGEKIGPDLIELGEGLLHAVEGFTEDVAGGGEV